MVRLLLFAALQPSIGFDHFLNGMHWFGAFDISGREVTGERFSYAGGDPQGLSFTYIQLDLSDSSSLVSNNLGGMGPRFTDPPYIRMRDVGLVRGQPIRYDTVPNLLCAATVMYRTESNRPLSIPASTHARLSLRIHNATAYEPSYSTNKRFLYRMMQINLRNLFDYTGSRTVPEPPSDVLQSFPADMPYDTTFGARSNR
jgi:hypothetical protein